MIGDGHLEQYIAIRPVDRTADPAQNAACQSDRKNRSGPDDQPGERHTDKSTQDGTPQPEDLGISQAVRDERSEDGTHSERGEHEPKRSRSLLSLAEDVGSI